MAPKKIKEDIAMYIETLNEALGASRQAKKITFSATSLAKFF